MADKPAQAFLSYAHADDEFLEGGITWLRRELQRGMQALTGEPFEIFQDKDGIAFGEHWPDRIEDALVGARFLIPILTPSYLASPQCRAEAATFLDLEKQAGRRDLILPIYLIEADLLESETLREGNAIARQFYERQYADWRDATLDLRNSPRIKQRVFDLAKQIKAASMRFAEDAPPIVPAQGPGIRFGLNKDGKIDRAPDEPNEITDDDPRLCSLQTGLQQACDSFLNSFHGDAGRNAFGPLISNVEGYREAIMRPLTEVQLTDVYRHGLALQNWMLVGRRDIDRLDPRPDLEDDQQTALSNLLGLHGPFILSTREGETLQAKADQDQMTAAERAELWSPALSHAAQSSDHATERAKAALKDVNQPSEDGTISDRRAHLALTTNRNFLSASGEAATGKTFADIDEDAAAEASDAASRFLLKNKKLVTRLAASTSYGLTWLTPLITWLGRRAPASTVRPAAPDAPAIVKNDFWTPGRVFRDIDEPWCPEMVVIPAGEFLMGSPEDEEGRYKPEGPQHSVTISRSFAIGRYPITFEEFDHCCDENGWQKPEDLAWGREQRPVINVSWHDANAYCHWLSKKTGFVYRLPTEAQWEYACRAGTTTPYAFGNRIDGGQAHFGRNAVRTCVVGRYPANAFGLFDMHGNVTEWCEDRYYPSYEAAPIDGSAWLSEGAERVLRGGSWKGPKRILRSACRGRFGPDSRTKEVGFRCIRVQE